MDGIYAEEGPKETDHSHKDPPEVYKADTDRVFEYEVGVEYVC